MLKSIQPTDIIIHPSWALRAPVKELADYAIKYKMFLTNRQGRKGTTRLVFSEKIFDWYENHRKTKAP